MTALEFLTGKTLTAIEVLEDKIINLVVGEEVKGLAIDTSNIQAGTQITRTTDFQISGNILISGNLTIDLSSTNVLTPLPIFPFN